MKDNQNISWWQVNNLVPIVTSAIIISLSYGALISRVAVLENKVDTILASQERMLVKYTNVEERYGKLAIQVAKLEEK